jgi:hypothetical protein
MAAASDSAYGSWNHPATLYQVRYSLSCFREIEFHVSEGFRRIPYGGIEHGGLLFGTRENQTIRVEVFRPIECEHAAGPSFSLSEKDKAGIREQFSSVDTQPELAGLTPLGVFISHSRHELRVSAEEKDLLTSLFSEPWQCLLIVKPAKFKPAQFAFVFRDTPEISGTALETGAFVLPLAPPSKRKRDGEREEPAEELALPRAEPVTPQPETPTESPTVAAKSAKTRVRRRQPKAQDAEANSPRKPKRERAKQKPPIAVTNVTLPTAADTPAQLTEPVQPAPLLAFLRCHIAPVVATLSLLPLAVCCVWFYWHYLEPPVEVHASIDSGNLIVSWPSGVTASAAGALLRISANQRTHAMALSPAQRNNGRAAIPFSSSDTTIELVASYWLHERRGMVRVIANH